MLDDLIGVAPGAFLVASALLILTPGQDMTLVMRNTVTSGRFAGRLTVTGILVGVVIQVVAAVVGLSALLVASATAFTVVKLAGAAYLAYLGLRMIVGTFRRRDGEELPTTSSRVERWFTQGLVSAVLNPKLGVFFLTFLPQFVDPDRMPQASMAAHGLVFGVMGAAWLFTWVAMLDRFATALRQAVVRRWSQRVAGTALVMLGARLAVADRT